MMYNLKLINSPDFKWLQVLYIIRKKHRKVNRTKPLRPTIRISSQTLLASFFSTNESLID